MGATLSLTGDAALGPSSSARETQARTPARAVFAS